jgi:hypothetical protein
LVELVTEDKEDFINLTKYNVIQTDVEECLLHVFPWRINSDTIEQEFRDVLWDKEASPEQVRLQIEQLQQDNFVTILNQRDDLKPEQVKAIAARLEAVRLEVLSSLESTQLPNLKENNLSLSALNKAEISQIVAELENKLESYLHYLSGAEKSVESQPEKTVTRENSI